MRWGDYRRSDNVEDRTGEGPVGGGGGFPIGGLHIGGGALIILVIVGMLFGINPFEMLGMLGGDGGVVQQTPQTAPPGYGPQVAPAQPSSEAADASKDFSRRGLGDTEDVWGAIFKATGSRYVPPTLVLYSRATRSGCGIAQQAVGPFYCPADQKLYLDTNFFNQLRTKFRAPGEFAEAYVIAHEVGHHVQNLLGTMDKVQRSGGGNRMSVALELQADCYAGVWANFAQKQGVLEAGDPEEALRAASAVGDDTIQKRSQGYV